MRLKKIRTGRTGLSTLMATVIIVVITLAIVISASLWSGGLSTIFTRYENVEVKNANITSHDGEHTVTVQYENVGSTETSVEDVLINDVPYSEYTPTPKLGGDMGSLPSACEIGVPKEGTISFIDGATDRNGNRLTIGVTLRVTISTRHGHKFQATMVIPDGGSQSSITHDSDSEINSSPNSSDVQTTTPFSASTGTRFRLGIDIPSSAIMQLGEQHGVDIDFSYIGGKTFYNYMTKGPGFFAHIQIAWGLILTPQQREFLSGVLDSADADNGRCEISIGIFGMDLGWPGTWEQYLYALLEGIGPNRPSMRFIILGGEYTYKNIMPPTMDELRSDFFRARDIIASYGYQIAWGGEGKYLANIPKTYWDEIYSWCPRCRSGTVSHNQECAKGAEESYASANWWERPNDVLLEAFTMWDIQANMVGVAPYYLCYDKFHEFIRGAVDRFDASNGSYPQSVLLEVLAETFNDVPGQVPCPFLEWWTSIAQEFNLRTSQTPPIPVRTSPTASPPTQFPPYPSSVFYVNARQNLPPFQVQAGGTFEGAVHAENLWTGQPLGNRAMEIYLVKQTYKGPEPWSVYPITKDLWENMIFIGTVITGSDGWGAFSLNAPLETGRYAAVVRVPPTDTEMEGYSFPIEFIIVTPKIHRVDIRTNVKTMIGFGPSAYGPSWSGVDPTNWCEPTKPFWGWCSEESWTFQTEASVFDQVSGKDVTFQYWLVEGGETPEHIYSTDISLLIDKDYILTAYYG